MCFRYNISYWLY